MDDRPSRLPMRDVDGILLLDKPIGLSSNAVLQRAKRAFRARKAGHTGNLDVLASGLLPICFGQATKVCAFLLDADKAYSADFQLGVVTTTGDSEGEVIRQETDFSVSLAEAQQAVCQFRGAIAQTPPMYSALKRNGQRLYKLARKGIEVEREARTVTIHQFEVSDFSDNKLSVDVACSKGTYIRTLAEDLGAALGCGAHVSALRRVRAEPFAISDAITLADLEARLAGDDSLKPLDERLLPVDAALVHLPDLHLNEDSAVAVTRGQSVRMANAPPVGLVRLYHAKREFLGVGTVLDDGRVAPRRLMRLESPLRTAKS